jgi:hypothetical protein
LVCVIYEFMSITLIIMYVPSQAYTPLGVDPVYE